MLQRLIRHLAGTAALHAEVAELRKRVEETSAARLRQEWLEFLGEWVGLSDKLTTQLKRIGARGLRQVLEGGQTWGESDPDAPQTDDPPSLGDFHRAKGL